jgi:hypothetical protein
MKLKENLLSRTSTLYKFDGPQGTFEAGRTYLTCKILRYKSSSVHSFREIYSSRENKHFKSLPVNSKRVKGIKKAGTSDSATDAEKRFKYEKEKRSERIFNAKWCEGLVKI